ncbi:hypothetical protein N9L68_00425 [bacterium]|nr:hypothetical protein [bacterium]
MSNDHELHGREAFQWFLRKRRLRLANPRGQGALNGNTHCTRWPWMVSQAPSQIDDMWCSEDSKCSFVISPDHVVVSMRPGDDRLKPGARLFRQSVVARLRLV